ncbi:MAG: RNA polymerase sigma factor [Planctomycetota bacterium]
MEPKTSMDLKALLAERPWVHALARSIVGDDQAADDVTQQTFLAALDRPPRHAAALGAWLARVARNFALRSRRDSATRRRHELQAGTSRLSEKQQASRGASHADVVAQTEAHQRIVGAVLELEEPYRSTIIEHFFREETLIGIAKRRGVPAGTVRSQLKRGLERLRATLRTESGDPWSPAMIALAAGAGVAILSRPAMVAARWGVTAATAAILFLAVTLTPESETRLAGAGSEGGFGEAVVDDLAPPPVDPEVPTEGGRPMASAGSGLPVRQGNSDIRANSSVGGTELRSPDGIELRLEVDLPHAKGAEYWFVGESEVWTQGCAFSGPWLGALSSRVVHSGIEKVELTTLGRLSGAGAGSRVAALVQLIPLAENGDPLPEVHYWAAESVLPQAGSPSGSVVLRRRKKPARLEIRVLSRPARSTLYLPVSDAGYGSVGWPSFAAASKFRDPVNVRRIALPLREGRGTVSGLPGEWVVLDRLIASRSRGDFRAEPTDPVLHLPRSSKGTRLWRGLHYHWCFVSDFRRGFVPVPYASPPVPTLIDEPVGVRDEGASVFLQGRTRLRARGWRTEQGWTWETTLVDRERRARKFEGRVWTPAGSGVSSRRWLRPDDQAYAFKWERASTKSYCGSVSVFERAASLPMIVSARTQDRWSCAWSLSAECGQFLLEDVPPLELKQLRVEVDCERLADQLRDRFRVRSPLEVRVFSVARPESPSASNLGEWRFDIWVGHADHWLSLHDFLDAPAEWDAEVGTRERRLESLRKSSTSADG